MARTNVLHLERYPHALPGEDRTYGGSAFYVDLVPRSVWFANLRAMLPPSHWRALSTYVIDRAQGSCEICGSSERLEAHERWDFNETSKSQKLVRLVCVCKLCHLSIHSGMAEILGIRAEVESHIFQLTLWGKREMKRHMKEAGTRWESLSSVAWNVDVSIAANAGLKLYPMDEVWRRIQEKQRKLGEKLDGAQIVIDGVQWDFSRELAEGCIVFLADTDEETLGGLPASGGGGPNYWVKAPGLVAPTTSRLDLKTYLRAYRRTYGISNNAELLEALKDTGQPKHLVLTDVVDITREMLDDGLRQGIIFSWT